MSNSTLRRAVVLLCGTGLAMGSAMAQQDAPPPPPDGQMQGPPPGGPRGGNPERRLEMLQRHLQLTPEQTAQVKAIFEGEHAKAEALRSNTDANQKDHWAQMKAIHEESEGKIQAILTPDQKTKYVEMEARMREHMQQRGPGGPPPPPPQ